MGHAGEKCNAAEAASFRLWGSHPISVILITFHGLRVTREGLVIECRPREDGGAVRVSGMEAAPFSLTSSVTK